MRIFFTVTAQRSGVELGRVFAESSKRAAEIWARRQHGRRASAMLVHGSGILSGLYQAYVPFKSGGLTSIGDGFRVS